MNDQHTSSPLHLLGTAFIGFSLAGIQLTAAEVAWDISTAISNRYVTEGMDNVPDGSAVLLNEVTATVGLFTGGIAYTQFLDDSYNELNFSVGMAGEIDAFAWEVGITYLTFPAPDEPSTWEIGVGVSWEITPQLVAFAGTYYDFDDVRGGFVEIGLEAPLAIRDGLTLTPYTLLGIDYGFVSGPRRLKENNWQFGISAEYGINDIVSVFASAHHSIRLSNLRAEGEGNVTWAVLGLTAAF